MWHLWTEIESWTFQLKVKLKPQRKGIRNPQIPILPCREGYLQVEAEPLGVVLGTLQTQSRHKIILQYSAHKHLFCGNKGFKKTARLGIQITNNV